MYYIPCVGGPIDGEVLIWSTVPKDGYVEAHGSHCYEFDCKEWQFAYHPLSAITYQKGNQCYVFAFGSHLHLCRLTGLMVIATHNEFDWPDAAQVTCRNRAVMQQRERVLETLYREGAL